jgi:hypothetical protein
MTFLLKNLQWLGSKFLAVLQLLHLVVPLLFPWSIIQILSEFITGFPAINYASEAC